MPNVPFAVTDGSLTFLGKRAMMIDRCAVMGKDWRREDSRKIVWHKGRERAEDKRPESVKQANGTFQLQFTSVTKDETQYTTDVSYLKSNGDWLLIFFNSIYMIFESERKPLSIHYKWWKHRRKGKSSLRVNCFDLNSFFFLFCFFFSNLFVSFIIVLVGRMTFQQS